MICACVRGGGDLSDAWTPDSFPSALPTDNHSGTWIRMDGIAHIFGYGSGWGLSLVSGISRRSYCSVTGSSLRNEMMGTAKEHREKEKCYRATTRESVNDCLPTGGEMERYARRRKELLKNQRREKTDSAVKTNLSVPQWADTG